MSDLQTTEKPVAGQTTANDSAPIVDMSTTAEAMRAQSDAKARRQAQFRESQQKRRAAKKAAGCVTVTVEMSAEEFYAFRVCQALQKGPIEGFASRALLMGAKFLANSGQPRGRKVKGGN